MNSRGIYLASCGTTVLGVINLMFFLMRATHSIGHIPSYSGDASPTEIGLSGHYIMTMMLIIIMYIGATLWLIMTLLYFPFHNRAFLRSIKKQDLLLSTVLIIVSASLFLEIIKSYGGAIDWLLD